MQRKTAIAPGVHPNSVAIVSEGDLMPRGKALKVWGQVYGSVVERGEDTKLSGNLFEAGRTGSYVCACGRSIFLRTKLVFLAHTKKV